MEPISRVAGKDVLLAWNGKESHQPQAHSTYLVGKAPIPATTGKNAGAEIIASRGFDVRSA